MADIAQCRAYVPLATEVAVCRPRPSHHLLACCSRSARCRRPRPAHHPRSRCRQFGLQVDLTRFAVHANHAWSRVLRVCWCLDLLWRSLYGQHASGALYPKQKTGAWGRFWEMRCTQFAEDINFAGSHCTLARMRAEHAESGLGCRHRLPPQRWFALFLESNPNSIVTSFRALWSRWIVCFCDARPAGAGAFRSAILASRDDAVS